MKYHILFIMIVEKKELSKAVSGKQNATILSYFIVYSV